MKRSIIICLITCLLCTTIPMSAIGGYDESLSTSQSTDSGLAESLDNLTPQELKLVMEMEKFLYDQMGVEIGTSLTGEQRLLTLNLLKNAVASLIFDVAFNSDSVIFAIAESIINGGSNDGFTQEYNEWYQSLPNTSTLSMNTYDIPTAQEIKIYAYYIDNNSDETVILHHGYHSRVSDMYLLARYFYETGYNLIIPEVRSHDNSGGKYITFGYYESEDLNNWVEMELEARPNQEIILYGVSMGAATSLMALENTSPSVKAAIEDCGYATLDQQIRDVMDMFIDYLKYIPGFSLIDWSSLESDLMTRMNNNNVKPTLKMDVADVSPLESVANSDIPKLFIHGDADTLIDPIAMELLYNNASGYKESLLIAGADHGASFETDTATYTAKVESFLATVSAME